MTDYFEAALALVHQQRAEDGHDPMAPGSPEQVMEQKIDGIIRDLSELPLQRRVHAIGAAMDDLIAISRDFSAPDIQRAIVAEEIAFWSVMNKAQWICSFIEARKPQGLRMVRGTRR